MKVYVIYGEEDCDHSVEHHIRECADREEAAQVLDGIKRDKRTLLLIAVVEGVRLVMESQWVPFDNESALNYMYRQSKEVEDED